VRRESERTAAPSGEAGGEAGPTLKPDSPLVARVHPSLNIDERRAGLTPSLLILHYTGLLSTARSIEVLTDPRSKVSCHYLIDEDGRVTQMVAEVARAWQAGVSSWAGETDINSASIGIEIQNPGHAGGYPDFPHRQMMTVRDLCRDIINRHRIPAAGVLAHSDVAPARKIDPGEKFDWGWLSKEGVGHWVPPAPPVDQGARLGLGDRGDAVREMQTLLARYGYGIPINGEFDIRTQYVVIAFQRHFRPLRVDGCWDDSCTDTLGRLLASLPTS
jgi:N-acetylmuramoyl-L-alanine amidase